MGPVALLLEAARRSRRRATRLRSPRTADMLLFSWLAVVIVVRVMQNSLLALHELRQGPPGVGAAIAEFTILHVLAVAFFLPFLASVLSLGDKGLNGIRLELTAVRRTALLPAELGALALRPLNLVILVLLVPAAISLASAANPLPSVIALAAAFVGVLLLAAAAGRAVDASRVARRSAGAVRYGVTALMIALAFANFDFQWKAGSVELFVFQRGTLLLDSRGQGLLPALRPWSPAFWTLQGYVVPGLLLAAVSLVLFTITVRVRHHFGGRPVMPVRLRARRPADPGEQRPRGARSLLFRKELRGLAARPATVAGFLLGVGLSAWLFVLADPGPAALVGCLAVYLCNFGWAADVFAADGKGIRRYALAGVPWNEVALSKFLAWGAVVSCSLLPLVAVEALRVSAAAALSLALAAGAVLALSLCWGIVSSILFPSAGPGARPAFVNQAAPFLLAGLGLAVTRSGFPFGTAGFDLVTAILLAAGILLFAGMLRRLPESLDRDIEGLVERMAAR